MIAAKWQQMTAIAGHNVGRLPYNGTFNYFIVLRIGGDGFKRVGDLDYPQETKEIRNDIGSFGQ